MGIQFRDFLEHTLIPECFTQSNDHSVRNQILSMSNKFFSLTFDQQVDFPFSNYPMQPGLFGRVCLVGTNNCPISFDQNLGFDGSGIVGHLSLRGYSPFLKREVDISCWFDPPASQACPIYTCRASIPVIETCSPALAGGSQGCTNTIFYPIVEGSKWRSLVPWVLAAGSLYCLFKSVHEGIQFYRSQNSSSKQCIQKNQKSPLQESSISSERIKKLNKDDLTPQKFRRTKLEAIARVVGYFVAFCCLFMGVVTTGSEEARIFRI